MSDRIGIRFKDSDAFPGDDQLARWLTICAMALNDLLYVNRLLVPRLQGEIEAEGYEHVYLARLAAAHLFEVAKFLEQSDRRLPQVAEFVAGLEQAPRGAYERVKALGPRATSEFAEQLEHARNQFFHYSALVPHEEDHEALKRAMTEHADSIGEIRDDGPPITGFRALFADDIAVELTFGGDVDIREFVTQISNHIAAYLEFAFAAVVGHVEALPSEAWSYIDREDENGDEVGLAEA